MVHKRRFQTIVEPQTVSFGWQPDWLNGGPTSWTTVTSPAVYSTQDTLSENHGRNFKEKFPSGDVGGNFQTHRITDFQANMAHHSVGPSYGSSYRGPWLVDSPDAVRDFTMALSKPISSYELDQLGATAVSRCIPTSPAVDGATALGELTAGLPQIPAKALVKSQMKDRAAYGSEYLNVQFGWLPLVSDLKKLGNAVQDSEKIMEQFYRDSGRLIRRRYDFPTETVNTRYDWGGFYGWNPSGSSLSGHMYDGPAQGYTETTTSVKTWFAGAFTYYAPAGIGYPANVKKFSAQARRLYGIELTPEVVWNLTPFSWLTDWAANTGDVLKNASRFGQDGLVMPYGYIMQERTATVKIVKLAGGLASPSARGTSVHFYSRGVSKVRQKANPYGFGVKFESLSGRQTAILAALGIAHRR